MTDAQKLVQAEIENLLRIAKRNNVVVCGFAFAAEPPMITNFGNCADAGKLEIYETLVKTCEAKRAKGQAESIFVGEIN